MLYQMAGDTQQKQLTYVDQLLLSIYIYIYPEASRNNITPSIHLDGGNIYLQPKIRDRCRELKFAQKNSQQCYNAYSLSSIRSLILSKILPLPLGVQKQTVYQLIDTDTTGFYLKKYSSNDNRGHCSCRVRYLAHYRMNATKLNVILVAKSDNTNIQNYLDGSIA